MTTMQESKNTLHVMDQTGDSRFLWDKDSPDEVAGARAQFDIMKGKGYLAYTVDESGNKGEVIREFDPNAQAIIMVPQTVGG
jgi:hypothetical protein